MPDINSDSHYEDVVHAGLLRGFKMVLPFGALLYLAFSALDRYTYPALATQFLHLRIAISIFILGMFGAGVYVRRKELLVWLSDTVIVVACLAIIAMIGFADGSLSFYYQGINLVFLVMFTINSYKALHNLVTGLLVIGVYAAVILLGPTTVDMPHFIAALFFLGSTLSFVVMMTKLYGSQRQIEYQQTQALAESAAKLSDANKKLIETENLKNDFFANASHELRTPLTLILGTTHNLRRSKSLPLDVTEDLNLVVRNAELLLKHVNELLDIAKLDAKKMTVHYAKTDIARLMRLIGGHFEGLARVRSIHFSMNTPEICVGDVDANQLEHILLNLLSNAFKFTPDGGSIHMSLSARSDEFEIAITDSGVGTTPEQKSRIFERFRQMESPDAQRIVGSGLGLSITNEFVLLHRGRLEVLDALPRGSIFKVTLPRFAPASIAVETTLPATGDAASLALAEHGLLKAVVRQEMPTNGDKPKILIVEDNDEMRNYLWTILADQYQIFEARDGEDALRLVLESSPDLIVSDVMMPRMDGYTLVKRIRQDKSCDLIPILLLSAKADNESREHCLREGAQDYVVKPFSESELRSRIFNLISVKLARDILSRELVSSQNDIVALSKQVVEANHASEKALVAAQDAAKAKEQFLSLLSHELRTPLTAIMGWADLLRDVENSADVAMEGLASIERNGHALLGLIDVLLDSTLMIRGRLQLHVQQITLRKPLESALSTVLLSARAKSIAIEAILPPEDVFVEGDRDRIQQVIVNLLNNAVKYTPKGGRIEVTLKADVEHAELVVSDNGEGIAAEVLPYIFERFRQGDSSNRRSHGGLGMGLAIARDITNLHGGTLTATSLGVGKGSRFTLHLPHAQKLPTHLPTRAPKERSEETLS